MVRLTFQKKLSPSPTISIIYKKPMKIEMIDEWENYIG